MSITDAKTKEQWACNQRRVRAAIVRLKISEVEVHWTDGERTLVEVALNNSPLVITLDDSRLFPRSLKVGWTGTPAEVEELLRALQNNLELRDPTEGD